MAVGGGGGSAWLPTVHVDPFRRDLLDRGNQPVDAARDGLVVDSVVKPVFLRDQRAFFRAAAAADHLQKKEGELEVRFETHQPALKFGIAPKERDGVNAGCGGGLSGGSWLRG